MSKKLYFDGVNSNTNVVVTVPGLRFTRHITENGSVYIPVRMHPVYGVEMPMLEVDNDGDYPIIDLELPLHTPLYHYVKDGTLSIFRLLEEGSEDKQKLYELLMAKMYREDDEAGRPRRFGIFNPKKRHSYVVVGNRQQMKRWLGDDVIAKHDNAQKVAALTMGSSSFLYNKEKSNNEEFYNILIVNHQEYLGDVLPEYVGKIPGGWEGTPVHDGCVITDTKFMISKYSSDAKSGAKVEYFQTYAAQARFRDPGLAKLKFCTDVNMMHRVMERNGFSHMIGQVDGVCSLSVIKSYPQDFKPGDVISVSLTDVVNGLRLVAAPVSDGTSSLGGQIVRLAYKPSTDLLIEKGAPERALILKEAIQADASAYERVLKADKDSSLGDAVTEYIKYLCYAFPDTSKPSGYRVPMYESAWRHSLARFKSFYLRDVIKCRTAKVSFKIQCDPELDRLEFERYLDTETWVNYVSKPAKAQKKVRRLLESTKFLAVGRNPLVGDANCQDVLDSGFSNPTSDTMYVSCRMWYSMFGDEDGDSCFIVLSDVAQFIVERRNAPPVGEPKSKYVQDAVANTVPDTEIFLKLVEAHRMISEAAINTGIADLTTRGIVIANKIKGIEMTHQEIIDMAEYCEGAIQSMKRKGGKTASAGSSEDNLRDQIVKKFWKHPEPFPTGMLASREYKLLTKNYSLGKEATSDSKIMMTMINGLNDPRPYCATIPHRVVWEKLQGVKPSMRHADSLDLRKIFEKRWNAICPYLKYGGYVTEENGVKGKFEFFFDMPWIIKISDDAMTHYRNGARAARTITENSERKIAFSNIKEGIRAYLKANEPICEENPELVHIKDKHGFSPVDYYYRAIIARIGMLGFGAGNSQRNLDDDGAPRAYSLPGGAFWYLPEKHLISVAKSIDPDNPWTIKAEESIDDILKKQEESKRRRQERQLAQDNELDDDPDPF